MTAWSKPSHTFGKSKPAQLSADYQPGITLCLEELIETKNKPIIEWLSPNSKVKTHRMGGFRSHFKGLGMDFDEVRLYQSGDDIRNIDWRVTARTGSPHTKLFKEERERPVFVVLDQMPGMFFGTAKVFKSLIASQIAAQIMWDCLANGDRFGALLFGEHSHCEMKPSGNRKNCLQLLNRIVESYQAILAENFGTRQVNTAKQKNNPAQNGEPTQSSGSSTNPLSETLKRLKYLAKPGTLIHIISDFNYFDDDCQRHLSKLAQHTDIHCLLISDPIESQLPPAGIYGITDGVNISYLNTEKQTTRQHYHQAFENKKNAIKKFTLAHKGIFTSIDTNNRQESVSLHGSTSNATAKTNEGTVTQ